MAPRVLMLLAQTHSYYQVPVAQFMLLGAPV